jgi:TPR repeat protein
MHKFLFALSVTAGLSLIGPLPAFAGFAEGVAAYKERDYETALREIRPLAEQGDAEAQHLMGTMFRLGTGVEKNFLLGLEWLAKAGEQGHLGAQARLGNIYFWGDPLNNLPQDLAAAKKWLLLAAEQGDRESQSTLGVMYDRGEGVTKNKVEALRWFLAAAAQKDHVGLVNIGLAFFKGEGLPQDLVRAYTWLILAGNPSHLEGAQVRFDLSQNLTPEQKSAAEAKATEIWEKLSDRTADLWAEVRAE